MKPIRLALLLCLVFSAPAQAETITVIDNHGRKQAAEVPGERSPWLTGMASLVVPGVGEMINGDWLIGAGVLAVNVALGVSQVNSARDPVISQQLTATRVGLNAVSSIGAAVRSNQFNEHRAAVVRIYQSDISDAAKAFLLKEYGPVTIESSHKQ